MNPKDSNAYRKNDLKKFDPDGVERPISEYENYKYIIPSGLEDGFKYINQTYNYLK
ncbi:hypothetical protein NLM59_10035 [Weeksellaceae bacterium KMM 9724]|uniref:hypothetical protein n=1 Tax=Profundicola chukchiensis TaxID=2961959 RepID=UPI0024409F5A|nr:hypothetical protein [Profundicola chukchiensis]MDG4951266.1 hypothetical protein [Profundicola chukchiensis]